MQDPDDLLAEVLVAVYEGRPVAGVAREWLIMGVLDAVDRGDRLDVCLGLTRTGARPLQTRLLKIERDRQLLAAVRGVAIGPELSDWQRCGRLAPLALRFMADVWPKCRRLSAPPATWPAWKTALFWAAGTGLEVPTSRSALWRALSQARAFSQESRPATVLATLLVASPPHEPVPPAPLR